VSAAFVHLFNREAHPDKKYRFKGGHSMSEKEFQELQRSQSLTANLQEIRIPNEFVLAQPVREGEFTLLLKDWGWKWDNLVPDCVKVWLGVPSLTVGGVIGISASVTSAAGSGLQWYNEPTNSNATSFTLDAIGTAPGAVGNVGTVSSMILTVTQ
jgi:hypothetical protein